MSGYSIVHGIRGAAHMALAAMGENHGAGFFSFLEPSHADKAAWHFQRAIEGPRVTRAPKTETEVAEEVEAETTTSGPAIPIPVPNGGTNMSGMKNLVKGALLVAGGAAGYKYRDTLVGGAKTVYGMVTGLFKDAPASTTVSVSVSAPEEAPKAEEAAS